MKKKPQTFYTGKNYTDDLKARLLKAGISFGALSRQTKIDRSQISRWFNTEMQPSLANVAKLEAAVKELSK
jgi:transcriptional regulator with XRE-family HTH domain